MNYRTAHSNTGSRTAIDRAIGILVGLRGCSPEAAFAELAQAVRETGIGLNSTAAGLVALASGSSSADHAEVFNIWGELVLCRRAAPLATTR